MRVCIPTEFRPQGGGFYFLQNFETYLREAGHSIERNIRARYDMLFVSHWQVAPDTLQRAILANPTVLIVHRIDGAAQDYGREIEADDRQSRVNELADLTIFQSNYCRYSTREKFPVIHSDGPVIHNPVDLSLFNPEGPKRSFPLPVVLAAVSWSTNPLKGADDIYDVARENPDLGFALCGNFPNAPRLPNMYELGVLDRAQLATVLRSCTALVTFSRNEACPNHVIEGLASGLPVLYLDSGAAAEIVGNAGAPVTTGTFRHQLDRVIRERDQFSALARAHAVAHFDPAMAFQAYVDQIVSAKARAEKWAMQKRYANVAFEVTVNWVQAKIRSMPSWMKKIRAKLQWKRVRASFSRKSGPGEILLVSDGAGWILDEVAAQLASRLPANVRARVDIQNDWRRARRSIIHFIERNWAWHANVIDKAHASNQLIGLWWHGQVNSPDPNIQFGLQQVLKSSARFSRIQVPTSIARDTLVSIGVPEGKLVLLPEGVDTSRFVPAESPETGRRLREKYGIPLDRFVIGTFQKDGEGWEEGSKPKLIKGPDVFADAMELLNKKYPIFVLMPGPARGYLAKRLGDAKVPYVNPGHVKHQDGLAGLYHALDVYVSPSRDEGGPAGVMEAMASRVPVVSSAAGIAVDIFGNDESGLLVPIEDPEALARACGRLFDDAKLRSEVAARGYETIQNYGWDRLAPRYFRELYLPLLTLGAKT